MLGYQRNTLIKLLVIFVGALSFFASVGYCSGLISDGLVGYWPFDETNGVVAHEASGNGLNGALTNFPGGQGNWVTGQIGGALQFGGLAAKEYVHVPDFTKPTTSLTVSAWVWADSMPQWATIAANWDGLGGALNYGLFGSDPYLSFYFAEPSDQGINIANGSEFDPPISLGEWHHVVVVANSSRHRVQFYRDGELTGFFFYSGSFSPSPTPWLNIGGEPSYGNPSQGYWDGKIDELALWNRALSSIEISNIYAAGFEGRSLLSSAQLPPTPPTITCSGSLTLEGDSAGVLATVSATVQDSTTNSITVIWAMDGTPTSTNTIPPRGLLTASNFTFTATFSPGLHVVTISASNGLTSATSCSKTVTVFDTTDQVRNGSFELTDSFGDPIDWALAGSWNLGWPNAPDGGNYAEIGGISQSVYTTPGRTYTLSFYAAGDLYQSSTSTVAVDWGGQTVGTFTTQPHPYDPEENRFLQLVWEKFTTTVTAVASSTVLTIRSTNNTGLLLDDVRILVVPPTISCSPPLLLECTNGGATGTFVANVQALSGNSVEVVWSVDATPYQTNYIQKGGALVVSNLILTTYFPQGEHVIAASASDGLSSPVTCSTALTVRDTTPPVITLLGPGIMTNECHASWIDPGATATDTCAGSLTVSTNITVNPDAVGLYTISYAATDPSGNSTTNTRIVRVLDMTPPAIHCPAGIEMDAQLPEGAVVNFSVTADDGCDPSAHVVCVPAPGSLFPIGETSVTCTATDASGNSTNCSFLVYIRSPAEMLTGLLVEIEALSIQHGVKNALLVKVKNALSNLTLGKNLVALNLLSAFENEVEAQRGGCLSIERADALLTKATAICASLIGPVAPATLETAYSGRLFAQRYATSGIDGPGWILMVSWAGNGILQSLDDLNGGWTDVPLAVSPYWTAADSPRAFFRVRPL